MSATTSGVQAETRERRLSLLQEKLGAARRHVRASDRIRLECPLDRAIQAFVDDVPFKVELLTPKDLTKFLSLSNPTAALFNQMASELDFWTLLDQLEELCFLQPSNLAILRPFIAGLYRSEVSKAYRHIRRPDHPFAYDPYLDESVLACQNWMRQIFGSGTALNFSTTLKLAKSALLVRPNRWVEGIPFWIKLSTLARLMGIKGDPLTATDEGREAYAEIVRRFIPEVGAAFTRVYVHHGFVNHCQGRLSAQHIILTPAGLKTWRRLEELTDDDFCFAPRGAYTGTDYKYHSVRLSRVKILLAGNEFPQDCIMTGGTIAVEPGRMSQFENLGMDCPANAYAPNADGKFGGSVDWYWDTDSLRFGCDLASRASGLFGSPSGRL